MANVHGPSTNIESPSASGSPSGGKNCELREEERHRASGRRDASHGQGHAGDAIQSGDGGGGRWMPKLVTQLAQSQISASPIWDFFGSLKSRVWRERYGTTDDLVAVVQRMFNVYDANTVERV